MTLWGEEDSEWWKKDWKNMPEFIQEDANSYQSILIHFEGKEDREEFAKLIDQVLTDFTKSIWYPKYDRERPSKYIYLYRPL